MPLDLLVVLVLVVYQELQLPLELVALVPLALLEVLVVLVLVD